MSSAPARTGPRPPLLLLSSKYGGDPDESSLASTFSRRPLVRQGEERAVLDVLRCGAPFRYYGLRKPKHVEALEAAARKFYGVKFALGVNSGTGAIMTAMTALGLGPGQEVIVPSFFWVSTVGAVVHAGAIPVLCEVDDSFCMDPRDLERKITPRTGLILPSTWREPSAT